LGDRAKRPVLNGGAVSISANLSLRTAGRLRQVRRNFNRLRGPAASLRPRRLGSGCRRSLPMRTCYRPNPRWAPMPAVTQVPRVRGRPSSARCAIPVTACTCDSGTTLAESISYMPGQRQNFDGLRSGGLDLRGPVPMDLVRCSAGALSSSRGPSRLKSAITASTRFRDFSAHGKPSENEEVRWADAARTFERDMAARYSPRLPVSRL
jgi:hypothetical protein